MTTLDLAEWRTARFRTGIILAAMSWGSPIGGAT